MNNLYLFSEKDKFDKIADFWHGGGTRTTSGISAPVKSGFFVPPAQEKISPIWWVEKAECNTRKGNKPRRLVAIVETRRLINAVKLLKPQGGTTMSQELIPISTRQISGQEIQTVNARDLHAFLESKQEYANWIKNRIADYNFSENEDFIGLTNLSNQKGRGGDRRSKDYIITLDMAKELAMVERSERGRQARKYFIECERRLKNLTTFKALPAPTLTPAQQREVQRLISDKVYATGNKAMYPALFKQVYSAIKDKFCVGKYDQVPAVQFNDLVEFIGKIGIVGNQTDKNRLLHCYDIAAMHRSIHLHIRRIQEEADEILTSISRVSQTCCILIPEYADMKAQKRIDELKDEWLREQKVSNGRELAKA